MNQTFLSNFPGDSSLGLKGLKIGDYANLEVVKAVSLSFFAKDSLLELAVVN